MRKHSAWILELLLRVIPPARVPAEQRLLCGEDIDAGPRRSHGVEVMG
ncbi:hypothetical protein ACWC2K_33600 [Streptomyces chattanoogensis]